MVSGLPVRQDPWVGRRHPLPERGSLGIQLPFRVPLQQAPLSSAVSLTGARLRDGLAPLDRRRPLAATSSSFDDEVGSATGCAV